MRGGPVSGRQAKNKRGTNPFCRRHSQSIAWRRGGVDTEAKGHREPTQHGVLPCLLLLEERGGGEGDDLYCDGGPFRLPSVLYRLPYGKGLLSCCCCCCITNCVNRSSLHSILMAHWFITRTVELMCTLRKLVLLSHIRSNIPITNFHQLILRAR